MKTPRMTKSIAPVAAALRSAALQWFARRAAFRMRFTSRSILIGVRITASGDEPMRRGLYRIPRSRNMQVTCHPPVVTFSGPSNDQRTDVTFASPDDAARAMNHISRRMLSNRPLVWASRIVGLAVCWLLVSSYMHVKDREKEALSQAAATTSAEPALAPLPDVSSPFQDLPSSPAPIAGGDMAVAQTPAAAVPSGQAASSSISASDGSDGLAGFGLNLGPSVTQPSVHPQTALPQSSDDLSSTMGSGEPQAVVAGPGCDPHLAFKAPAY